MIGTVTEDLVSAGLSIKGSERNSHYLLESLEQVVSLIFISAEVFFQRDKTINISFRSILSSFESHKWGPHY